MSIGNFLEQWKAYWEERRISSLILFLTIAIMLYAMLNLNILPAAHVVGNASLQYITFDAALNKEVYFLGEYVTIRIKPEDAKYSIMLLDPNGNLQLLDALTFQPKKPGTYVLNVLLYYGPLTERFTLHFEVIEVGKAPTEKMQEALKEIPVIKEIPTEQPGIEIAPQQFPVEVPVKKIAEEPGVRKKEVTVEKERPEKKEKGIGRVSAGIINPENNPDAFYLKDIKTGKYKKYELEDDGIQYRIKVKSKEDIAEYVIKEQGLELKEGNTILVSAAVFKPQFRENGIWQDIAVGNAIRTFAMEEDYASITIQKPCLLLDCTLTESYQIGFDGKQYVQKISVDLESGSADWQNSPHRMLWEIQGIDAGQDREEGMHKRIEYGKILVDFSDYKGNSVLQESAAERKVTVIFEPEGKAGNLNIDPSLKVAFSTTTITIASTSHNPTWNITADTAEGGVITILRIPYDNNNSLLAAGTGKRQDFEGLDNFFAVGSASGQTCWVSHAFDSTEVNLSLRENSTVRAKYSGSADLLTTGDNDGPLVGCLSGTDVGNINWTVTCLPNRCAINKTVTPTVALIDHINYLSAQYNILPIGGAVGLNITLFNRSVDFFDSDIDFVEATAELSEFYYNLPLTFDKYHGFFVWRNESPELVAHMIFNNTFTNASERHEAKEGAIPAQWFFVGGAENDTDASANVQQNLTFVIWFDNFTLFNNASNRMQGIYQYLADQDSLEMITGTLNTTKQGDKGADGFDESTTCYTVEAANSYQLKFNHSGSATHNVTYPCYEIGSWRLQTLPLTVMQINKSGTYQLMRDVDYTIDFLNASGITDNIILFLDGVKDEETQYSIGLCDPPTDGIWNISVPIVCENKDITMNGNISINTNGNLTLINTTIRFNSSDTIPLQYGISIDRDARINISDRSNLTVLNGGNWSFVGKTAHLAFFITDSHFSRMGHANVGERRGLEIIAAQNHIIRNNTFWNNFIGVHFFFVSPERTIFENNIVNQTEPARTLFGLNVGGSDRIYIANNTIYTNGSGQNGRGIELSSSDHDLIENNHVSSSSTPIRQPNVGVSNLAKNATIRNNTFISRSSVTVVIGLTNSSVIGNYWNSTQIQINQGNFSRWINNTFNVSTGSHAVDVNLETYLNFTGNNIYSRVLTGAALLISSHNSSFWNNTIYGSANDSILLSSFVNATQNVFFNNTINSSSEYAVRVTNGTNNIFYRNHFLGSKGINATVGNTSFCENGIGNLYNESITPALMGSGDCGQANITDTLNGATLSGIVVVNWTAQSSFQNVTYNLYLDNGSTLLVSTQELNFSWDTAGSPDGAHQLYLVPNITSFGLRFNATTNLSEQFTLSNAGAAPPNVSYPLPFPNSSFRNGTKVEISANITDDGRLDRIYANITYPSGVTVNITMFNSTTAFNNTNPPNNFSVLFNDTSVTGLYNVSFFANDTDGNVNNTIKTNFSLQDPCGCLLDNGGTETGTCRVENGFCTSSVNITVNPNANLTLINTTLRMETSTEGAIGIRALQPSEPGTRGGYLNISHSSNITNASAAYSFIIEQNTNFSMTDSVVSGVGWSHDTDRRGLEISSKVTQFRNNTIQKGFYGLVLRSNNNTIENTTVKEYSDHGAGGSAGILLNISHNTTLRNVVVLNWFSSLDLIGGINLFESHNNSIKDSILINSGSDDGILISNSNSTLVNNTKIINASGNGIFVRQSTNTNITNNTITQTSDTTGFSAISMPSGSSRPVSTRIIGNAIYNISSTVGAQINCGDCIISENIFFNNSETPGLILLNFPGIGNITNNTIKHNNVPIGILVDDFPQNERIRMVENNSIINNSFSRRAIEITGNFTTVRNNTLINNTGIGIYTAGSPVGSRSLRNITIRENLVRNHGNDSAEHWPIYIGISNVTMERNIIFENRAVRDLYIDTVSKVNATLNHFLSKGVNGTDLVNSSFCNLVDSLLKGNFYNESITPTFIGTGDCGLANITDTIDRGIFKGNITVNWTNQSSFKEIMTYSIFEGNGTLFGTTTLNNLTINTSQMHDGFHILRIVPNITEFDLRINATVNLSENFTVDNFPPDIRVNEWGGDTAYPYETTNRTPELNGTIIEDFGNCRTSRTNESFDNMANDINCTGGNPDPGISCIVPTDLAPGFYTYFVACNSTLGNKDGPDGTNQNFTIEIVGNTECILNPSFAGVSFGEMGQDAGGLEESNTTEDDRPRPLLLFNNGTVLFNVTLNATNLWNVSPNPSNNFLYRIEDNETNSFYGAETTDWVQMQRARDSATTAVDRLRYVNGTNTANTIELELNITVPVEEDPGDKDSSIDVFCLQAES